MMFGCRRIEYELRSPLATPAWAKRIDSEHPSHIKITWLAVGTEGTYDADQAPPIKRPFRIQCQKQSGSPVTALEGVLVPSESGSRIHGSFRIGTLERFFRSVFIVAMAALWLCFLYAAYAAVSASGVTRLLIASTPATVIIPLALLVRHLFRPDIREIDTFLKSSQQQLP